MKQLFTLIFLVFFSCSSNPEYEKQRNVALGIVDSVELAKETATKDSIQQFHNKEQNKVISDIEFGITKKQFQKLSEKYENTHVKDNIYYTIGDYVFSRMDGYYYKDKLHEVDFDGDLINYKYYDTQLLEQVRVLKSIISNKYGPSTYGDGPIESYRTQEDRSYLAYGWTVGTKEIQIKIRNRGVYYSVDMEIFQMPIRKIINEEYQKKQDSTASKAANTL